MTPDSTYWIALSALQSKGIEKVNRYLIDIYSDRKSNLLDHAECLMKSSGRANENHLDSLILNELDKASNTDKELNDLGIDVIPIVSDNYPKALKDKLKTRHAPPVLFVKGDASMLHAPAAAIVGSRDASRLSLDFAASLAGKLARSGKVIVSGYARGVDTVALESAAQAGGRSIIVLPQGILKFKTGLKKLEELILNGQVLVLSYFHPQSPWSVGLAMARNKLIYSLSEEIFVAESGSSGGTWSGALEGIKRGDQIFVRTPQPGEHNANSELILKGANPVVFGKSAAYSQISPKESTVSDSKLTNHEEMILNLLEKSAKTSKEIIDELNLNLSPKKLANYLAKNEAVEVLEGKPNRYILKSEDTQEVLF